MSNARSNTESLPKPQHQVMAVPVSVMGHWDGTQRGCMTLNVPKALILLHTTPPSASQHDTVEIQQQTIPLKVRFN